MQSLSGCIRDRWKHLTEISRQILQRYPSLLVFGVCEDWLINMSILVNEKLLSVDLLFVIVVTEFEIWGLFSFVESKLFVYMPGSDATLLYPVMQSFFTLVEASFCYNREFYPGIASACLRKIWLSNLGIYWLIEMRSFQQCEVNFFCLVELHWIARKS